MMMVPRVLVLLVVLCAATLQADAAVTIEMKHDGQSQTMYVTDDKFSADYEDGMMIFRPDLKLIWMVNRGEGKYFEVTEEDMAKLAEKIADAKSQMEAALKNLPAEQRAMAEKMMAGKMPAAMMGDDPEITVKDLGQSKIVNGFKTNGYEVSHDGVVHEEVWAAKISELKLKPADFQVFSELADFMKTGVPGLEDMVEHFARNFAEPAEDEVPGFPVLTIRKDAGGKEVWRSELVKIERGDIPAGKFEKPEGLKKEKLGFGG